jgi:ribosomal protein L7/L12
MAGNTGGCMRNLAENEWQQIDAELFAGRKIQAIKLHRIASGAGLKEAKETVEAREAQWRASNPEKFAVVAKGGCMTIIAIFAGALLAIKLLA